MLHIVSTCGWQVGATGRAEQICQDFGLAPPRTVVSLTAIEAVPAAAHESGVFLGVRGLVAPRTR